MQDVPCRGLENRVVPREQWPTGLADAAENCWCLELRPASHHGTHRLVLVDPRSASPPAELSFDHDDERGLLHVGRVHVSEQWRRRGLAQGLYDALHDLRPDALIVHTELSASGQHLVGTLPPAWNIARPEMLDLLPLDCTGSMIDPGGDSDVLLVHATDWCPVHECDCGAAMDQEMLDDQEELLDRHLDGEPFDPWWPHEPACGVRRCLPRQGVGVMCSCWHTCTGQGCSDDAHGDGATGPVPSADELGAALMAAPTFVVDLLRTFSVDTQLSAVTAWVAQLRRHLGHASLVDPIGPVLPRDLWDRFVCSGLPVEAGFLPGCVSSPSLWGRAIEYLHGRDTPLHGYVPGRWHASGAPHRP